MAPRGQAHRTSDWPTPVPSCMSGWPQEIRGNAQAAAFPPVYLSHRAQRDLSMPSQAKRRPRVGVNIRLAAVTVDRGRVKMADTRVIGRSVARSGNGPPVYCPMRLPPVPLSRHAVHPREWLSLSSQIRFSAHIRASLCSSCTFSVPYLGGIVAAGCNVPRNVPCNVQMHRAGRLERRARHRADVVRYRARHRARPAWTGRDKVDRIFRAHSHVPAIPTQCRTVARCRQAPVPSRPLRPGSHLRSYNRRRTGRRGHSRSRPAGASALAPPLAPDSQR